MLHEKSEDILKGLFKSASFVIQAICFKKTGKYISRQTDLLEFISPEEQRIVNVFLSLKNGGTVDFDGMSEILFDWSKSIISN